MTTREKQNPEESWPPAQAFLPGARAGLPGLWKAAQDCRACDLFERATQAVLGEGPVAAKMMLIGEQPGDQEDLQGKPFVGPAGRMLDKALVEAKIDRAGVYVTNAVKHFKWTTGDRGKRRLHSKPSAREVKACFPWLQREIGLIEPRVIVTLGGTAGQALFGGKFRINAVRGQVIRDSQWAPSVVATIHPSAILRDPDPLNRKRRYEAFVHDLAMAGRALNAG